MCEGAEHLFEFRCTGCGGPITLKADQYIIISSTITYGDSVTRKDANSMWCGECTESWDTRMPQSDI